MRILHVITLAELGGAQRYLAELATRQRACGFEVEVAAGAGDWLFTQGTAFSSVHRVRGLQRSIAIGPDGVALRALNGLIHDGRFDVVHTHSAKAGILGRLAAALQRVPIVAHTSHGIVLAEDLSLGRRVVYGSVERIALSMTDLLYAVSETERSLLERTIGRPRSSIRVMTIVPTYIREITTRWDPLRSDPFELVAVGNLYPTKGYDRLLESLSRIAGTHPAAHLTVYGQGPELGALTAQATRLGIEGRVRFAGFVADTASRVAAAGIFVMPSRKEGLPLALLEAMAVGAPICATDVGAIGEALGPDVPLVRANDAVDLARRLDALLASEALRVAAAADARRLYECIVARDDPHAACRMYQ